MLSNETSYDINDEAKKEIEVTPLTKWKRILVFLSDFFLNGIIAFLLFNIAVAPISKSIINFNTKNQQYIQCQKDKVDVFAFNDLIKSPYETSDDNRYVFSNNLENTYVYWLSYYVLVDGNLDPVKHPDWGHNLSNNTIWHFYNDIRGDLDTFHTHFDSYNSVSNYFEKDGEDYKLKSECIELLKLKYDPENDYKLLSEGTKVYSNIKKNIFLPFYTLMLKDVEKNNLTFTTDSGRILDFKKSAAFISAFDVEYENMTIIDSFVSFALAFISYYVLVPLIRRDRKTVGMLILHAQLVNVKRLEHPSRKDYILTIFYNLFASIGSIFILPVMSIGINAVFGVSILPVISLISLVYLLASLVILVANSLNRGLSDVLGQNVMLLDETLDVIYKERGYY